MKYNVVSLYDKLWIWSKEVCRYFGIDTRNCLILLNILCVLHVERYGIVKNKTVDFRHWYLRKNSRFSKRFWNMPKDYVFKTCDMINCDKINCFTFWHFIQEFYGSDLWPENLVHGSTQFPYINAWTLYQIKTRTPPPTYYPVYCSLIILTFNAILFELMAMSLNRT
jgi:hypothetical protein